MRTFARPRLVILAVLVGMLSAFAGARSDTPLPAAEMLSKARAQAAKEKKNVLVGFSASWCGWCHRMQKTLSDPKMTALMDKYFVTVWLDVLEQPSKKNLENPGAADYLQANGGDGQGIPFLYFMDDKGKTLINSMKPGPLGGKASNTGCPYEDDEIAHWLVMLKKAAPKMSAEELAYVKTTFEGLKKADKKIG